MSSTLRRVVGFLQSFESLQAPWARERAVLRVESALPDVEAVFNGELTDGRDDVRISEHPTPFERTINPRRFRGVFEAVEPEVPVVVSIRVERKDEVVRSGRCEASVQGAAHVELWGRSVRVGHG